MFCINSKIADEICAISNHFDDDYDQDFLKINNNFSKQLSKLGFQIFNYLNSADNNFSSKSDEVVKLSKPVFKKCVQFLSVVEFLHINNFDITDQANLVLDDKMINDALNYLLFKQKGVTDKE